MELKQSLKNARENAGYSQARLSRVSGISRSTINAIEMGKHTTPSLSTITTISEILEVEPSDLIKGIERVETTDVSLGRISAILSMSDAEQKALKSKLRSSTLDEALSQLSKG